MNLLDEIQNGESRTLEFKQQLPTEEKKYLKTVVAFSNEKGGRILFGVHDETHEILGVDSEKLFLCMDSIANAVSSSCYPPIVPDLFLRTVGDKTLIILDVHPGQNKPYFLKSEGVTDGTYIRVGATTRRAEYEKIQEFLLFGKHLSYDEQPFSQEPPDSEAVYELCSVIANHARKPVTVENLAGWGVLCKSEKGLVPSNAFELLTQNSFTFARILCGAFKGTEKTVFLDKRELDGPIYRQIEEAYQFVLRHLNLGVKIQGIYRQEKYELPPEAIREILVNAVVHRNYLAHGFIRVAVFDDRLEVSSPGTLYGGVTIEEIRHGTSSIRNRVLADVFSKMKIMEHWGTGLAKVFQWCGEYNLPEPKIEEIGEDLVITLFKASGDKTSESSDKTSESGDKTSESGDKTPKSGDKTSESGDKTSESGDKTLKSGDKIHIQNRTKVLDFVKIHGSISSQEAQKITGLSASGTRKLFVQLTASGQLVAVGERKLRRYFLP